MCVSVCLYGFFCVFLFFYAVCSLRGAINKLKNVQVFTNKRLDMIERRKQQLAGGIYFITVVKRARARKEGDINLISTCIIYQ